MPNFFASSSWNHPYGIWNHQRDQPGCVAFHHETIPMGFETKSFKLFRFFVFAIMKPSLWDLKLRSIVSFAILRESWNHPYGIWNNIPPYELDTQMKSWNHPYGIWNFRYRLNTLLNNESWNHPYGIWNSTLLPKYNHKLYIMKPSLWDLKPPPP